MKQSNNRTLIYKIHTKRFRRNKWELELNNMNEAMKNDEIIALGDAQFFRALRDFNKEYDREEKLQNLKKELKIVRKNKEYSKIYTIENKINSILLCEDVIQIVCDSDDDYDKASEYLKFNGCEYKELIGTTGGVKNKTIFFIKKELLDWANKRLDNGRDLSKEFIPSKLGAYKALDFSASTLVTNTKNIIVIDDAYTNFKDNVIELSIDENDNPVEKIIEDYEIELCVNDGFGFISPEFEKQWRDDLGETYQISAFIVRNSYCKGALATVDFKKYAREVAHEVYIKDIWGNYQSVLEADIILTASMLKLWDSYKSLEDYIDKCELNHYGFCVTKITPKKLDVHRALNYQFIQPVDLSDKDIDSLIEKTVKDITGVLDSSWENKVLFSRGFNLTEENADGFEFDYIKALMIDERMTNDPFVMNRLYGLIEKRIRDAKKGILDVRGNYTIILGDVYGLLQHMFGHEVTGILSAGELYMDYWNGEADEVCCFRAPMSSVNNIRKLKIHRSDKADNWYQYLKQCSILNSWDTTVHTLNGLDYDGDLLFTTNESVFLSNIDNKESIVCIQSSGDKKIPTVEDLHEANKKGFNNAIGTITNEGAKMFDLMYKFKRGSEERLILEQRIRFIQLYQQMAIDELKGIVSKDMPKEWTKYEKDMDELKHSTVVKSKPYFLRFRYKRLDNEFKNYERQGRLMLSLNEELRGGYEKFSPTINHGGTMNRVCNKIESIFDGVKFNNSTHHFDETILKSNVEYSMDDFAKIKRLYKKYVSDLTSFSTNNSRNTKEEQREYNKQRDVFKSEFRNEAYNICQNSEQLCDMVVDICYKTNNSKQFAWDICGEQIIENLLNKNDRIIKYLYQDKNGDIEYSGLRFSIGEKLI